MHLAAGQRFILSDENAFAKIISGKADVNIITREKSSFRQIFMMEISAGEAAFPSLDEFEIVDVMIYASEDLEFELVSFSDCPEEEFISLAKIWFAGAVNLPFFKLMANYGDETPLSWLDGSFLDGSEDRDALIEKFIDNESILSTALGAHFKVEDKKLATKIEYRENQKKRLVEKTLAALVNENAHAEISTTSNNPVLDVGIFVVQRAAKALKMEIGNNFSIPDRIIKKLGQFGVIRRLVQKNGMYIRRIELEKNWHRSDCGVIMGFYGKSREVAMFLPQKHDRYIMATVNNPDGVVIDDEVAAQIDGTAFLFYAGLPKDKLTLKNFLIFLFKHCWQMDWRTIFFVSIFIGLTSLVTPIITETLFSDIIPILDREGMATITQVALVAGFATTSFIAVRTIAILRLSVQLDTSAESAIFGRILNLPTSFFRKYLVGDLASRLRDIRDIIESIFEGGQVAILLDSLFAFWNIILMCFYSVELTAVSLAIWLVYGVLSFVIFRKLIISQRIMISARNATAGVFQQIISGLLKFRIRGSEEQAYALWGNKFKEEWHWNYKVRWLQNYNTILNSIQPIFASLILYVVVFQEVLANNSDFTYATFIAFQTAYVAFNLAMNNIIPAFEEIIFWKPSIDNLKPFIETETESTAEKLEADVFSGAIEVRQLVFSYEEDAPNVVDNMSFKINAGENVAIVGKSGCGKSTLLRLLLGFETPKSGEIYYDEQDLSELDLASVRAQMGVVLQNGQLMPGTIFTNIAGDNNLTLEDAWRAAESAGIADDIRQMPMGMQTIVSEGSTNISGGQRQRILIAKAIALNPAIIIFDEATSALDNHTQAIVTRSLEKMKATRIVVAHRLSTIRNADRIIVLDKGHIIESGTYEELVKMGGLFAGLAKRQTI